MCSDILHFTTWWYLDRVLFEPFPNGITLGRSNEFWLTVMTWHLLWDEHLVHICLFKSKERLLEVPPPLLLQNIPTANPARSHGLGMNFILSLDLWPVHAQKITIHFLGLPKSGTLLFHTSQKKQFICTLISKIYFKTYLKLMEELILCLENHNWSDFYLHLLIVAKLSSYGNQFCVWKKWTWNLKITCLKRKLIFQTFIFGFHFNFQGWQILFSQAQAYQPKPHCWLGISRHVERPHSSCQTSPKIVDTTTNMNH